MMIKLLGSKHVLFNVLLQYNCKKEKLCNYALSVMSAYHLALLEVNFQHHAKSVTSV